MRLQPTPAEPTFRSPWVAFGDPTVETLHHYAALGVERTILGASRADLPG